MKTCKQRTFFVRRASRFWLLFGTAGFFFCGCQNPVAQTHGPSALQEAAIRRVRILGLTDFAVSQEDPQKAKIKTYVELLDADDVPLKRGGVFRFELYEFQPLLANPRGMRLTMWLDIDLTDPDKNNQHWKDYLKSYEFYLPLEFAPAANRNYLLEVTCLADNKRLGGILKIRYQP